jgi:UPF0755 protein
MKLEAILDILKFILGLMFNIALMAAVIYMVYSYALEGYGKGSDFAAKLTAEGPDSEVEFVLEEDTPVSEAARMLEELGVIRNEYWFQLDLFLKGSSTVYKAGTYKLNKKMSVTEVNVAMRKVQVEEVPDNIITVPEGWTVRDIATYLEDKELMTAEEFVEACDTHEFPFSFAAAIPERANRLEGYLFPDTYYISPEADADEIIYKMLARFDEIFSDDFRYRARELGATIDDIVIAASIIEKEVKVPSERALVSRVIYNRLEIGQHLEIDATILYALDKRKDRLLYSDLEIDSPYNTYVYGGLPLGPISNPGQECLEAALYPESGPYLYYVLQDEETGEHYFTDDYDDFLNAKARYQAG